MARDWDVAVLTTQSASKHPAFDIAVAESNRPIDLLFMPEVRKAKSFGSVDLFAVQVKYYLAIKSAVAQIATAKMPDVVYMVNIDIFDKAVAVLGSPFGRLPWVGMMMCLKFHRYHVGIGPRSRSDALYRWLFQRLLRIDTLKAVTVIDQAFLKYATENLKESEYSKLAFVPDVGELAGSESKAEARRRLGIANDSWVVLVYGSLSARKGVKELLAAMNENVMEKSVTVHLAGVQDPEIEKLLAQPSIHSLIAQGRIILSAGFHDSLLEYRAFVSCDFVWLGYVGGGYGSSGVLYQACSLGLPVIATEVGLIGWLVRQHGLGVTIDPTDSRGVALAITNMISSEHSQKKFREKLHSLGSGHTAEKFGNATADAIVRGLVNGRR